MTAGLSAKWSDYGDHGAGLKLHENPVSGILWLGRKESGEFSAYGGPMECSITLKAKSLAEAKVEAVALVRERLTAMLAALPGGAQ